VIVLDTSGLLAALDADQGHHVSARTALQTDNGPFLLSPFVLAELDYLLMTRIGVAAETALLGEVGAGAYDLMSFNADDVAAAVAFIERYKELQIGLADASVAGHRSESADNSHSHARRAALPRRQAAVG
jgi:uncharacterized protein